MHSIAKLIQLRSDLKISVVWFICQTVVGNIVNVITLFKFLDKPIDLSSILINLFKRSENSFLIVRGKPLGVHKIHQLIEVRSLAIQLVIDFRDLAFIEIDLLDFTGKHHAAGIRTDGRTEYIRPFADRLVLAIGDLNVNDLRALFVRIT